MFSSSFLKGVLVIGAVAVSTSQLSGCMGGLLVAQLVPTAIAGYMMLPGGVEVELEQPGKGVLSGDFSKVQSVITDNFYSQEYLEREKDIFKRVTLAKNPPNSPMSAASAAEKSGHDAFLMVDSGSRSVVRSGFVLKTIYGSATVTVVSRNGDILYKQTATMLGKTNSPQSLTERQIAQALSQAIIADLKQAKQVAYVEQQPTSSSVGIMGKIKGIFN